MKLSVFVLLFTFICGSFALFGSNKVCNITEPNASTVWQFGQIYEVKWVTEFKGSETLKLFYYEGNPTECNKQPFMSIEVPYIEAGSVFFNLDPTKVEHLSDVMEELPVTAKKYFLHFGDSKDHSYSESFTINGGLLNDQQVAEAQKKNANSGAFSFAYTTIIAIIIGVLTTAVNIL